MKAIFALSALALVGGCYAQVAQADCGAQELQDLIGQPSSVLSTMRFADPVRILEFGQPMTMDHNPDRLNIQSDSNGVISRVWCG